MLNDPKTTKDYKAFFVAMKQIISSIAFDKVTTIVGIKVSKLPFWETEFEASTRFSDLMNAFQRVSLDDMHGDVHVLCTNDTYWDYPLIRNKLLRILKKDSFQNREVATSISQAVVKIVTHPSD